MTRLSDLRRRLARLRGRRVRLRLMTGYSGLMLAVLWVAAVAFAVDLLFEMDRVQRMVALAACLGVTVWALPCPGWGSMRATWRWPYWSNARSISIAT